MDYFWFIDRKYDILSRYLIDRMIEHTHIKPKELMFYNEEYLKIKVKDIHLVFIKYIRK